MLITADHRIQGSSIRFAYSGPNDLPCCVRVDEAFHARLSSKEKFVRASRQGPLVILRADDSEEGREFGGSDADAIITRRGTLRAGRAFYAGVKSRLAEYGRSPNDLRVLPAAVRPATEGVRS